MKQVSMLRGIDVEPIRCTNSSIDRSLIKALPMTFFGMLLSMRGLDIVFNLPLSGVEIAAVLAAATVVLGVAFSRTKIRQQLWAVDTLLCILPLVIGFVIATSWTFNRFGAGSADYRVMVAFIEMGVVFFALVYRTEWQATLVYGRQGAFALGVVGVTLLSLIGANVFPLIEQYAFFSSDYRFRGLFEHPNQMAMVLSAMIPILLTVQMNRGLKFGASAVALYLIVLSGSKANMTLAIVFPYLMFILRSAMRRPFLFLLSTMGSVAILVNYELIFAGLGQAAYVFSPAYRNKVLEFLADPSNTKTLTDRQRLWSIAYDGGTSHPIWGMGWSSIQPMSDFEHLHNVWLNYFFAYGVFGLSVVLMLHLALFRAICVFLANRVESRKRADGLFGLWVGATSLMISTYTSDSMGPTTFMIFIVLIVLLFGEIKRSAAPNWSPIAKNRTLHRSCVGVE